jgi:hypothetical protein
MVSCGLAPGELVRFADMNAELFAGFLRFICKLNAFNAVITALMPVLDG